MAAFSVRVTRCLSPVLNELGQVQDGFSDVLQEEVLIDSGGGTGEMHDLFPVLIGAGFQVIEVFPLVPEYESGEFRKFFHGIREG